MDNHWQGHGEVLFVDADHVSWGEDVTSDEIIAELRARVAIMKAVARKARSKQEEHDLIMASNILLTIIEDIEEEHANDRDLHPPKQ